MERAVPNPIVIPTPEAVQTFDDIVDARFDAIRGNPWADRLFYAASEIGDFSLIWHLIGAVGATIDDSQFDRAVRASVLLGVESALVNGAIKSLFRRERPTADTPRPHRLRTPKTSSFPSGHASAGFMAASLLSRGAPSSVLLHLTAAAVATSRVHVKIHHPSDVVAGAILGAALGRLGRRVWPLR